MNNIFKTPESKKAIMDAYETILHYWPRPCQRMFVPTDYGDTFVMASGAEDGKPVVLLHGSMSNSAIWLGDAVIFGKKLRVYAVDIIGEPGLSAESRPKEREHYARWLGQVLDGLGVEKAAFVGNSLGAWMAMCMAAYYPERVESLVLIAPGGLSGTRVSFLLALVASSLTGQKGAEKLSRRVYGNLELPPEALAFAQLISSGFIPRKPKDYRAHPDKLLRRISCPVLFIGGDSDPMFSTVKNAERLKRLVPNVCISIIKGAAHALTGLAEEASQFIENTGVQ